MCPEEEEEGGEGMWGRGGDDDDRLSVHSFYSEQQEVAELGGLAGEREFQSSAPNMKLQRSLNSREFREARSTGQRQLSAGKPGSQGGGGGKMKAIPVRQQVMSNNFF